MNLYVSNLSFQTTDDDLKELFSPFGTVTSAKVINDRMTGKSRGFGFVEMPEKSEALKAISELNESTFDGKVVNVNEARPKTDKPRGQYNDYNKGGRDFRSDRRSKSW
jgi:RNA recognition motif-containing protein